MILEELMTVSKGLARASRIMAWLSRAGAMLGPVLVAAGFFVPAFTQALGVGFTYGEAHVIEAVPLHDRLLALPFALVPAFVATWGLFALARLFRGFAEGDVFSVTSLRALSQVTAALFWNVTSAFILELPISYFLTAHNGHHELSLTLGSGDVQLLFLAGVAFVLARVMAEARSMAEENASFV